MPKINGKIYYNNVTGDVLLAVPQNEGVWLRKTTFAEDVATYPQLKALSSDVISVLQLAWGQCAEDLAVSRPVKVEDGKLTWVPFDAPETEPISKPFSERIEELEQENKVLKLQNTALSDRADFIDDTLQDLILTLFE